MRSNFKYKELITKNNKEKFLFGQKKKPVQALELPNTKQIKRPKLGGIKRSITMTVGEMRQMFKENQASPDTLP